MPLKISLKPEDDTSFNPKQDDDGKTKVKSKYIQINVQTDQEKPVSLDVQDSQRDKLLSQRSAKVDNLMFSSRSPFYRDFANASETVKERPPKKEITQIHIESLNPKDGVSWREEVEMSNSRRDESPTSHFVSDNQTVRKGASFGAKPFSKKAKQQEVIEDEEQFYHDYQEVFDNLDVPDKIIKYKADSRKKKVKNICQLMLLSLILIAFSTASFILNMSDVTLYRMSTRVLVNLCNLEIMVSYVFSSTLMSITQLKDSWMDNGRLR